MSPAKEIETLTNVVLDIKRTINRYFECDPWNMRKNKEYDPDYSAEEVIDDIVNLIDCIPADINTDLPEQGDDLDD